MNGNIIVIKHTDVLKSLFFKPLLYNLVLDFLINISYLSACYHHLESLIRVIRRTYSIVFIIFTTHFSGMVSRYSHLNGSWLSASI